MHHESSKENICLNRRHLKTTIIPKICHTPSQKIGSTKEYMITLKMGIDPRSLLQNTNFLDYAYWKNKTQWEKCIKFKMLGVKHMEVEASFLTNQTKEHVYKRNISYADTRYEVEWCK